MTAAALPRQSSLPSTASVPRWWPTNAYYGWALVGALGFTATVSYGILSYGFAAFVTPMGADLGWSKTQVTGAFSLGQLVAGLSAIPVGRWVDRHGARGLMTTGSVVAALLLVAWSRVESLPAFYALWAFMGVAMAAVLYEPAFAVMATWFNRRRSRALTILTFMGGFASVIFVPVATMLVAREGWRAALLALAAIYAVLTVVPHALVLRRRPSDLGLEADSASIRAGHGVAEITGRAELQEVDGSSETTEEDHSVIARKALGSSEFQRVAVAFTLSGLTTTAISVHLIPLLLERGYSLAFAGSAMGLLGLMALPGRLVFTPLGARWPRANVSASIFALQAVALAVMLLSSATFAIWIFVVLFGAGFGAISPARAATLAEMVPATIYGRVSGVVALTVSLARAAGPVGASVLYAVAGGVRHGYDAVLLALLVLSAGSAVTVFAAGNRQPTSRTFPRRPGFFT